MTLDAKDIWRLNHILIAIGNIEKCVLRKASGDELLDIALQKLIQNIGEMCRGVSNELKKE